MSRLVVRLSCAPWAHEQDTSKLMSIVSPLLRCALYTTFMMGGVPELSSPSEKLMFSLEHVTLILSYPLPPHPQYLRIKCGFTLKNKLPGGIPKQRTRNKQWAVHCGPTSTILPRKTLKKKRIYFHSLSDFFL